MSKTVVVGRLRAVYPDHIVLGGNLNVLIPRLTLEGGQRIRAEMKADRARLSVPRKTPG